MTLNIDYNYGKHYNEFRSKEIAAKTKKTLKRQIKEIEEESSSSSSDGENDECNIESFKAKCDNLLRDITSKGSAALLERRQWFDKDSVKEVIEKPLYPKDFIREILIEGENENDLADIERASKQESESMVNSYQNDEVKYKLDSSTVTEKLDFIIISENQPKYDFPEIENTLESGSESCHDYQDDVGDDETDLKVQIDRKRNIDSVRVSKTMTRAEKRKNRKENKEKELKEKMKKLQELKNKELSEKLEKIKKNVPEIANYLTVDDLDDDNFDIDEYSKKMAAIFESENANLPEDKEKPVFSDESDADYLNDDEEDWYGNEEGKSRKKVLSKQKTKKPEKTAQTKKKLSFFTNSDLPEETNNKKKFGILRKTNEVYNPEKHGSYRKYLKKTVEFLGDDLITGIDDTDDIVCKFKYREAEKQDYGLNTEEILMADAKELNKWASLKKVVRLRTQAEEAKDRRKYSSEGIERKKRIILASLFDEQLEEGNCDEEQDENAAEIEEVPSKSSRKRMRKAEKKKKSKNVSENELENNLEIKIDRDSKKKKKSKKTSENEVEKPVEMEVDQDSKKINNSENEFEKLIEKEKCNSETDIPKQNAHISVTGNSEKSKSKKSHKKENKKSGKDSLHKVKKSNKNKTGGVSISTSRLESLGVKPSYYKHLMSEASKKSSK